MRLNPSAYPSVLQIECHPYFAQEELRRFAAAEGILVESWYLLGHGVSGLLGEPELARIDALDGKKRFFTMPRAVGAILMPMIRQNYDKQDRPERSTPEAHRERGRGPGPRPRPRASPWDGTPRHGGAQSFPPYMGKKEL